MPLLHRLAVVLIATLSAVTVQAQTEQQKLPCQGDCPLYGVSMIQLIAAPAKFDGKRVRVIGFLHFEFEGDAIYLHREDFRNHVLKNGLWASVAEGVSCVHAKDAYSLVDGTFHAGDMGHMDLWSGAITNITRCVKWSP